MKKTSEIQRKLGKRIRELRLQKNITSQMALGYKAKIDRTYIGGVERGERNISIQNIEKVARALDVTIQELFKF